MGRYVPARIAFYNVISLDPENAIAKKSIASITAILERLTVENGDDDNAELLEKVEGFKSTQQSPSQSSQSIPKVSSGTGSKVKFPGGKEESFYEWDSDSEDELSAEKKQAENKRLAEAEMKEANILVKSGNFDQAITMYKKAWELHKDVEYLEKQATAEYKKGSMRIALETCREAIEYAHGVGADKKIIAALFYLRGEILGDLGENFKAYKSYQKSSLIQKEDQTFYKVVEFAHKTESRLNDPTNTLAHAEKFRLKGNDFYKKGMYKDAVEAYHEATRRSPHDVESLSNRADIYYKLMKFYDAIADCNIAIQEDPKFIKAYIRKALCLLAIQDYNNAIDMAIYAKELDVNHQFTQEADKVYKKARCARFHISEDATKSEIQKIALRDHEVLSIKRSSDFIKAKKALDTRNMAGFREVMLNSESRARIHLMMAGELFY